MVAMKATSQGDKRCNLQFLRDAGLYEPDEDAYLRQEVLGLFYELTQTWVKGVCRKKNLNVEDARAHVYTFGSYRLGVHGPGVQEKGTMGRTATAHGWKTFQLRQQTAAKEGVLGRGS